jgi:NAD(P)-dependent dehydrogenase (short-subunit alcohol dehydrogenase family)
MQFENRVFVITGGASGLGAATARRFVARGAKVVLADLDGERAGALAAELGVNARSIRTDVTDDASGKAAVDLAVESFGSLHGLVNCAGIVIGEKVLGRDALHDLERFSRVLRINVVGTFNMIRHAAHAIAKNVVEADNERGLIINTASIAAYDGQVGQAAYAASKGAVVSMTLPLAREFSRTGIRVMTIAPGVFETPMVGGMSPELQKSLGDSIPFPSRLGRAAEFATLAEHIVENVYLNGEVIRLDGAVRLAPR